MITEPTDMEKRGEFVSDEDDSPGAKNKIAHQHMHEKDVPTMQH